MDSDISKALAYQVKKEIAERYFGTKRLIEDDISNLKDLIEEVTCRYEKRLGPAFVRLYSLLMDDDIIEQFIGMIGWKEKPFYDSYIKDSVTIRKRLLEKMRSHGWMKKSKFSNMVFDAYRMLYKEYCTVEDILTEIDEERAVIEEELKIFKNKYSLDEIMSFVRNLDFEKQGLAKVMGGKIDVIDTDKIAQMTKVEDIEELEKGLPYIHTLPKPDIVEDKIRELAGITYSRHPEIAAAAVGMAER